MAEFAFLWAGFSMVVFEFSWGVLSFCGRVLVIVGGFDVLWPYLSRCGWIF